MKNGPLYSRYSANWRDLCLSEVQWRRLSQSGQTTGRHVSRPSVGRSLLVSRRL